MTTLDHLHDTVPMSTMAGFIDRMEAETTTSADDLSIALMMLASDLARIPTVDAWYRGIIVESLEVTVIEVDEALGDHPDADGIVDLLDRVEDAAEDGTIIAPGVAKGFADEAEHWATFGLVAPRPAA